MVYKIKYINYLKEKVEICYCLGHNFNCCEGNIAAYLDEEVAPDCWELLSIVPKPKINIINAYLDSEEDDDGQVSAEHFVRATCPSCAQLNVFPLGMETGKCQKCKKEFVIADNPEKKEESK